MKRRGVLVVVGAVVLVVVAALVAVLEGAVERPGDAALAVARVIDGDTIEMQDGSRVRYIGIDTPEEGKCYAEEATARNRELVEGMVVAMTAEQDDMDDYGRLLRQVHANGVFVNVALVEEGFARVVYIVPNTELYPQLKAAQDTARAAGRGLWGACY